ncbi:hypothetical protein [Aneurinibacillus uraniidurans]|uniref:hypothetical protein n=1 Tax=Aneurinibacillus uraniidurans TaxID=2966586 RepID=UPI0023494090|nr:hypothetical protein [Aneurinibacillus sp. B1]WCN36396.1 hypothetical protein PO771_10895 [Aneurinibacillus sp. B1]
MDEQFKYFLSDLITLIQEKYNETLIISLDESVEDKFYRLGSNFAYYDVLDLVESQVSAHGYKSSSFGKISPIIGEKIQEGK